MTTFDRYLLRRFVHVFVVLFITMYGLFVVIDGFTNVDEFQRNRESVFEVLAWMGEYYSYQASLFFDLVGPILAAIATVVALSLLVRNSEVQPILAAGIPLYRLAVPLTVGVLLVEGMIVVNREAIVPRLAPALRSSKGGEEKGHIVEPVYDHKTRLHIAGKKLFLLDRRMTDADFTLPVPQIAREFTTLKAPEAVYQPETAEHRSGWLLREVTPPFEQLHLTENQACVLPDEDPNNVFVATDISFDQLYNRSQSDKFVSTAELIRRIRNPSFGTVTVRGQTLHLHTRLTQPLANLSVVFVVLPLVIRRESRGLVGNLAICMGVLTLLLALTHLFSYLGSVNFVSTALAAWLPIITAGSLGAWLTAFAQT